ncbi:hypothetical protein A5819_001414 [Enterococcus sp. 7E2_DIV0204]|uniref:DeoR family transcriptional regulator n=1 Tax=unclassified Enterococcus TaxID=2608891 RepID=UPI000A342189|nr:MULTISPECIES: DeoR family transcriptional regulator [unclassified Enterococcus]OTN88922.1 hypothetical protein A5819_001414 [Enterococcus sp. 7E2_DIV0204]OTP51379.1 hypothetical protein A5884_000574 [Enterococcus sp. 7D2_DIV0200]
MKTSQGDVFRRRENIIEQLLQEQQLTVKELATLFNVSAVTIRRDLLFLEKKKMIERFYGGVKLIQTPLSVQRISQEQVPFPVTAFVDALTVSLPIQAQIFVGAGLFSTEIIQALAFLDISILTNDAAALTIEHPQKKALISICGGELERESHALVGDFATHSFHKVQADLCIIEASGFNSHEVTTKHLSESFIYRTMLQHTKGPKIVYTSAANLETVSQFMIDRTFLFDKLYTDATISSAILSQYQAQGIPIEVLTG